MRRIALVSAQTQTSEELIISKRALYMQMDRTWKVEVAIADNLAGAGGERKMMQRLLDELPNELKPLTLQQAQNNLETLGNSAFYSYSCKAAQASCDMLRETISDMVWGKEPRYEALRLSPSMRELAPRLQFFVRCVLPPCEEGGVASTLVGKDALRELLKVAEEESVKGENDLKKMEPFHVFGFMLDEADKERVTKLVDGLLASSSGASAKKRAAKVALAPTPAKQQKTSAKKASNDASKVMDLFS